MTGTNPKRSKESLQRHRTVVAICLDEFFSTLST
jgi:hypothetical protein